MKTAIIVGHEGQDGRLAVELLQQKQYKIIGIGRRTLDITRRPQVEDLIKANSPDEIYYLAAFHHSSQDQLGDEVKLFEQSYAVHVQGLLHCCEAMKKFAPQARLFYACSLIFEGTSTEIQDETTAVSPQSVYAMTKLNGLLLCRYYRERYGVFASGGILYNHESRYRAENFITSKIIKTALDIKAGVQDKLVLGDLEAQVDWGYAPDYVQAMYQILNAPKADDFIIATGIKHSVRDFVQAVFEHLDLDWTKYVHQDPSIMVRKRRALVGDTRKLRETTGWQPTVDFKQMVRLLLD